MEERLIIHHLGPVTDLDIVIKPLTLFIGEQGSGKSTIAKLYATFRWLEKALLQGRWTEKRISQYDRFRKVLGDYSRLKDFFGDDTYLAYEGKRFDFVYDKEKLHIRHKADGYDIPKIMYVPAERSVLSVMDTATGRLAGMPAALAEFNDTFVTAKTAFSKGFTLPFSGLEYDYDKLNGISWIKRNGDYRIRLTEAASGIQSSLPLCLVTAYLSDLVGSQADRPLSPDEQKRLKAEVQKVMKGDFSDDVKAAMLTNISNYSRYSSFVNIVEELELSLFPRTQVEVLRFLMKHLNSNAANTLLLTTHSPYLLSALNISILAAKATALGNPPMATLPKACQIAPDRVAAYALGATQEAPYCRSVLSEQTHMVSANDLDTASSLLAEEFNSLYAAYTSALRHGK